MHVCVCVVWCVILYVEAVWYISNMQQGKTDEQPRYKAVTNIRMFDTSQSERSSSAVAYKLDDKIVEFEMS